MKIISYNVNGIRSAMSKGLDSWVMEEKPDILCMQEIKAQENQIDKIPFDLLGYHQFYYPAEKKGYSGVAILSKEKPLEVKYGAGHPLFDSEGRIIQAVYKDFSVISVYMPSGTSGEERQGIKYEFLEFFKEYTQNLLKDYPNLVISGDYNIANTEQDIHDPKGNAKNSGFLPEERKWLTEYWSDCSMVDSFRHLNPSKQKYSWWSFRFNARKNNKGWRIDYHAVSNPLKDKIIEADCLNNALHSDHCPILLEW